MAIHCYKIDLQIYNILQQTNIKKNVGYIHFCFLFLNWKVLSSKIVTVFFQCQKPPTGEISWETGALTCDICEEKKW